MSSFINNIPNTENLTKFNEPKNINHLVNESQTTGIKFHENLEGYLVGTSFEETNIPKNNSGNIRRDEETNNYFVVTDDECPFTVTAPNQSIYKTDEEYNFSHLSMANTDVEVVEEIEEPDYLPELKTNTIARFYVGSLSIIGLLIFFRMLYRVK